VNPHPRAGLAAGVVVLSLASAPAALAAPRAGVRIEGAAKTLVETRVARSGKAVPGAPECDGTSAGAAIERATKGRWDRKSFTSTVLGETHDYSANDYWAEWIDRGDGYEYGGGICTDHLRAGDQLLMVVDQPPYGEGSGAEVPLNLKGVPRRGVRAGRPVTLRVTGAILTGDFSAGAGSTVPIAGATVSGGGQSAITNRRGRATLRFRTARAVTLRATKAGDVPSPHRTLKVRTP
jgi:hypothetical protein